MKTVLARTGNIIAYTTENGRFVDKFEEQASWWTNGFWPAYLLDLYTLTKDPIFLDKAKLAIEKLDPVLSDSEGIHHDVGFMWYLSAGKHYQMTKDPASRERVLTAAKFLASRYDLDCNFIIAWNSKEKESWSIIDTMMNLPLLWFATEETGYSRYAKIARAHGDKTLENFIRPDGSVEHIVVYDPQTGAKIDSIGGQGYEKGSSWSRGQSWAVHGFAELYRSTGEQRHLDAAKRVAHYFLANAAQTDYLPLLDFRAPATPVFYDTTAGAIAASGMLAIASFVLPYEKALYLNGARQLLEALRTKAYNPSPDVDYLLDKGSEAYGSSTHKGRQHISIIYGDYYFLEALTRLRDLTQK